MTAGAIALLAAYGPELRAFVHSGLATRLARERRTFLVLPEFVRSTCTFGPHEAWTPLFSHYPNERRMLQWLRSAGRNGALHRLTQHGHAPWRHYIPQNSPKTSSPGSPPTSRRRNRIPGWLSRLEPAAARIMGGHASWSELLVRHQISTVVASGMNSARILPALQTASNLGLNTAVIANSWKDVFVNPHVPLHPTALLVPTGTAREALLAANPSVPPNSVLVRNSLHLQCLYQQARIDSDHELLRSLGIDPKQPFICYTMASPNAVQNEIAVLRDLGRMLNDSSLPSGLQILVRSNPMDSPDRLAPIRSIHPRMILQIPDWDWRPAEDWCAASARDATLWPAIVRQAAANVSVASTVTLEFALLGKPVINVCFDLPDPLPDLKSSRRFWHAPFYSEVRERSLAVQALTAAELEAALIRALQGAPPCRPPPGPPPAEEAFTLLQELTR